MKQIKIGRYIKDLPRPLLDAVVRGDVVPFVGSGFSKNCDGSSGFVMPDWKSLGKAVASELNKYEYDGNPIEALSTYEVMHQRSNLVELIRRLLRLDEIYPGEAHHLFSECFSGIVCTTNFDNLIEDAY